MFPHAQGRYENGVQVAAHRSLAPVSGSGMAAAAPQPRPGPRPPGRHHGGHLRGGRPLGLQGGALPAGPAVRAAQPGLSAVAQRNSDGRPPPTTPYRIHTGRFPLPTPSPLSRSMPALHTDGGAANVARKSGSGRGATVDHSNHHSDLGNRASLTEQPMPPSSLGVA